MSAEYGRSEEHTSELQSLTVRRSSDLFMFEVMENRVGGVLDELRVEQFGRVARQFHGHHVSGIRYAFAGGHFKEQAIGGERDHYLASSFFTSCTKSVASWKRRYTLAKRT